jgi:hypothetical protein
VRKAIAGYRRQLRDLLAKRIGRDRADGLLPPDANAAALADLVIAVMQGLSVMARDGGDRAALQAVVDAALEAWPAR